MALCSNAQMNDEGFAAAIRDIERLDMMLAESVKNGQAVSNDSLPASGNSEGNPGVSMFNITGTQYPNGGPNDGDVLVYSSAANAWISKPMIELSVCVDGVSMKMKFAAIGPY